MAAEYGASEYSASGWVRGVVIATILAGMLDLLSAFAFAAAADASPLDVLAGIGSGVADRGAIGDAWLLAGVRLALHFGIMAVMVAVYFALAARIAPLNRLWMLGGIGYGMALWGVMDRLVLPQRWPTLFPLDTPAAITEQLFDHVVLVGLTIAFVARLAVRWRSSSPTRRRSTERQ